MKSEISTELGQELALTRVVKGKNTYPSWTTGTEHALESKVLNENSVEIFYQISSPIRRKVKRTFPRKVSLTASFLWTLGFLKGEGANKLGKSNYRRVTITNTNAEDLLTVLLELEKQKLLFRSEFKKNTVHIFSKKLTEEIKKYWIEKLDIPKKSIRLFLKENSTTEYGVCHIYVSDVLLRRILDLIEEHIRKSFSPDL